MYPVALAPLLKELLILSGVLRLFGCAQSVPLRPSGLCNLLARSLLAEDAVILSPIHRKMVPVSGER